MEVELARVHKQIEIAMGALSIALEKKHVSRGKVLLWAEILEREAKVLRRLAVSK
jgi:hypothetical protein